MVHLESLLSIKRGEGRLALLVVAVMLLTSAGFTLGSTGVEALFFARFGVEYLPYMYMILAHFLPHLTGNYRSARESPP